MTRDEGSGGTHRGRLQERGAGGAGALLAAVVSWSVSCGHAAPPVTRAARDVVIAYDDNRASAQLTFPNLAYESLVRFQLPPGKHRLLDVRLMAQSAGTVVLTVYGNTALESPGEVLHAVNRVLAADDVSNGQDGRWVVEDLQALEATEGVVWIGVRKLDGNPALWTSATVSGQTFLRRRQTGTSDQGFGLLPVKRSPMLRLELLP